MLVLGLVRRGQVVHFFVDVLNLIRQHCLAFELLLPPQFLLGSSLIFTLSLVLGQIGHNGVFARLCGLQTFLRHLLSRQHASLSFFSRLVTLTLALALFFQSAFGDGR